MPGKLSLKIKKARQDFPILKRRIKGKKLVYFDNAATTQKPESVIAAENNFYRHYNANIHRGIYQLSEEATTAFEKSRKAVANFLGGVKSKEIIFTKSTTESINLVMRTWGEKNVNKNDEIIISTLEHHSNLVPWQELCRAKKAILKIVPLNNKLQFDFDYFTKALSSKTKLVAVTHISNTLGTILPVNRITKLAHQQKALVLVDGAQAMPHFSVNVKKLDADFYAFSSHKCLGPLGVGVLYAKQEILEKMPPFLFGGDMISEVHQNKSTWNELPYKFEAGTQNIAGVIGLGESLNYLQKVGLENIWRHEQKLLSLALKLGKKIKDLTIYSAGEFGSAGAVFLFNLAKIHDHDLAELLDERGIAVRSGHHCAQLALDSLKIKSATRASFYFYNNEAEVRYFFSVLKKISDKINKYV